LAAILAFEWPQWLNRSYTRDLRANAWRRRWRIARWCWSTDLASAVTGKDFRGLKKLRETTGERFAAGVVMYDGENVAGFGENLFAIPIRALWETI
jgi:hypothetical protein